MKKGRKNKSEKHEALTKDYTKAKQEHLEYLTNKILKRDEKFQKLKEKKINKKFLDLF